MQLFRFAQTIGQTFGKPEDIIGAYLIIFAKRNQMKGFHIVFTCFVAGINSLIDTKIVCNFGLGFVMIFTQLPKPDLISLHNQHPPDNSDKFILA